MRPYQRPAIKSFDSRALLAILGTGQMQYEATMNVYGGRSAFLGTDQYEEYRLAQGNENYGIVSHQEVSHA